MVGEVEWPQLLDDRQRKELELARLYDTDDFRHGTDGHNRLLLIAKLASLLDRVEREGHDIKQMWRPKE
jgi:hypothetical protein